VNSFPEQQWSRYVRVAKAYNSEDFDVVTCHSFDLAKKIEPMDEVGYCLGVGKCPIYST